MSFAQWKLKPEAIFAASPVIPVLVIHRIEDALHVAQALMNGGIHILEITLRTPIALQAITLLRQNFPDILVGAGTVLNKDHLTAAEQAGAQFAISPGLTPELLAAGSEKMIPFIPGVASVSELMIALNEGYTHFKFFPAEAAGGIRMLQAMYGPFPQAVFCPTGGIHAKNMSDYLKLSNVKCVGGSWLFTEELLLQQHWEQVTELAAAAYGWKLK